MLATLLLAALSAATPAAADPQAAGIHRCYDDSGNTLYTDKPCAAVHARDIGGSMAPAGPFMPAYRNACIRSLREFTYELSNAIEVGDVNRLAALYRWQGTSTRAGYAAMARLQEIAARPLLQVEPVYPAPAVSRPGPDALPEQTPWQPPEAPPAQDPQQPRQAPATPPAQATPSATPSAAAADPYAYTPAYTPWHHGPPIALRLDQTLANGVTPAPTTLRLQRDLGCWWVSL